ncbi:MAG: Asp-tRNA(Asn)/Glu-tRNA(Gln) amidotransferase GatCAB subunit C, partial [Frankiales bacterium]|nr:Asp-tRNA(Asn)/Glu-tRNA(Gln) amidotransferase GatCAB subunit C [Frankiales bacterium]
MIRTHGAGTLRRDHEGAEVVLTGWVATRRDHGGVTFVDLRDGSGVVQVVLRDLDAARALRSEWCVKVTGTVAARKPGNENPELPTGAIEVVTDVLTVLSESAPLPFPLDEHTDVGEEIRL